MVSSGEEEEETAVSCAHPTPQTCKMDYFFFHTYLFLSLVFDHRFFFLDIPSNKYAKSIDKLTIYATITTTLRLFILLTVFNEVEVGDGGKGDERGCRDSLLFEIDGFSSGWKTEKKADTKVIHPLVEANSSCSSRNSHLGDKAVEPP